jgi:hypothetical protein
MSLIVLPSFKISRCIGPRVKRAMHSRVKNPKANSAAIPDEIPAMPSSGTKELLIFNRKSKFQITTMVIAADILRGEPSFG